MGAAGAVAKVFPEGAPQASMADLSHIRNFAIIAHIALGKSTLAARLIPPRGGLRDREMKEPVLDSVELERERGIHIKDKTGSLSYTAAAGSPHSLNPTYTPRHSKPPY